jgi:hypothetical protein
VNPPGEATVEGSEAVGGFAPFAQVGSLALHTVTELASVERIRQVQRWIASLTLIAYLIGGWLLPVTHHHGAGVAATADCGAGCHSHAPLDANLPSQDHPQQSTCSHAPPALQAGASANSQEGETEVDRSGGSEPSFQSLPHASCQGLCALCVARSLSSQRLVETLVATGFIPVGEACVFEPPFLLQRSRGIAFSRGPPLFV